MGGYLFDRELLANHLKICEYCRILVARRQQELDELKEAWLAASENSVIQQ